MATSTSTDESTLILYDLPSKGNCASWSLNPWKTRLALNFKRIDYKTHWVEYPDIEPLYKSLNVSANATLPPYTIPAVRFPTGEVIQDSRVIASKIEETWPSPSLRLDDPSLPKIQEVVLQSVEPLRPVLIPHYPKTLLTPRSAEYFERTRSARFGMPLSELAATRGGEPAWQAAAGPLKELVGLIEGPYVLGDEVSYADFVIVAFLQFVKRGGGTEIWSKLLDGKWDEEGKLRKLYDSCGEWLIRDSY